jgi:uncharacterized membrane protein YbaN (DUF454 family)
MKKICNSKAYAWHPNCIPLPRPSPTGVWRATTDDGGVTIMLRKLLLWMAGLALTVLGMIGLVLPVLPGLLLLVAAAGCFSLASPRFRHTLEQRLHRHPRCRRALRRWQSTRGLPAWSRMQLAFWLTVGSLLPEQRR